MFLIKTKILVQFIIFIIIIVLLSFFQKQIKL